MRHHGRADHARTGIGEQHRRAICGEDAEQQARPVGDGGDGAGVGGVPPARAASCSRVPAATTCPALFTLAGVSPQRSIAALTSSGSPPTTALMPVGVTALAAAIARPRSRTSTIACSLLSTPASAAAANSPTEWPAETLQAVLARRAELERQEAEVLSAAQARAAQLAEIAVVIAAKSAVSIALTCAALRAVI